jgi:hypothetical protein
MELFSLRKIRKICPQHRGPGPPAPAHGSTDFIKRWPLATGSMTQIRPIESVSLLGCLDPIWRWVAIGSSQPMQESPSTDPMAEAAGSGRGRRRLALAVARHGRARRLTGVWFFLSYSHQFSIRFTPTESQRWRKRVYPNLNRRRVATKPGNGEVARPVLVDVGGGLREASAPRTCAKASLSSLLASQPTNCSDRRRKTRIWWLPRLRWVLELWLKIRTICGAIYRGF